MQTTIDRLYEWVDFKGDSIYKLSKEIEVSNGYFSKQKQSNGAISSNIIEKIVSYYTDLDANWFLTGKGEKTKRNVKDSYDNGSTKKSTNFSTETKHKEKLVLSLNESTTEYEGIPLIPIEAMAGFGTGGVQVMDYDTERYVVPEFTELNVDFMLRVKGSSMYPKYNSGDLVACKKLVLNDIFFQWNKVYVLDTDQGALIKRIKKGSDDHLQIVSDNPSYEPYELHLSKIHAIAIVLGVIRLE